MVNQIYNQKNLNPKHKKYNKMQSKITIEGNEVLKIPENLLGTRLGEIAKAQSGKFKREFKIISFLGSGSYGHVNLCENIFDEHKFAIKKVKIYIKKEEGVEPMTTLKNHRSWKEVVIALKL